VKRVIEHVDMGGRLSIEATAEAGFKVGWRRACLDIAEALGDCGAPPHIVAQLRALSEAPPQTTAHLGVTPGGVQ
jgi:hypothetical protein